MATKRMLIDASHPEETRVVAVNGTRLEDFDVEVESRRQLKGNIYLAKVTRVEPSLQAAFVDYGGNRHGFLAFTEIHPDYYQIPVADREALIAEEAASSKEDSSDVDGAEDENGAVADVETLGGDDSDEVEVRRPVKTRRHYKIQEVIKRRQILLVQVVKEERGTKGAALTTYLSLAGRYCVLMPNTARGGGISRKISNGADRKRLKSILTELKIPQGMAIIVRTAGSKRSKAEIKRDYDYLIRLWTQVREVTLESIAPCLVHEEANLIKRSIRDLYTKDIDEVIIDGEQAYRLAKDFMKLLIPSHAKRVQPYKEENVSLTSFYQVESQLDAIHSPQVQLKSGGYIVINPTEALVSIDVNSGRATRERNIEETALKTNLEAAVEIARQLKLRDLAGLIVIDFIDMEVNRNQTKVERQLKDAMRSDRARIQIGRISPFGLLELSRQRLRPSLIETSSEPCPHCEGTGLRRSTDSTALHMLRVIEEEARNQPGKDITVYVPTAVALYLLNHKRPMLAEIEQRSELSVFLEGDDSLIPPDHRIERDGEPVASGAKATARQTGVEQPIGEEEGGKRRKRRRSRRRKRPDSERPESEETLAPEETAFETISESADSDQSDAETDEEEGERSKRRRRGRRGGRRRGRKSAASETDSESTEGATESLVEPDEAPDSAEPPEVIALPDESAGGKTPRRKTKAENDDAVSERTADKEKKPGRRRRTKKADDSAAEDVAGAGDDEKPKPRRRKPRSKKAKQDPVVIESAPDIEIPPAPTASPNEPELPAGKAAAKKRSSDGVVVDVGAAEAQTTEGSGRRGWWQKPAD